MIDNTRSSPAPSSLSSKTSYGGLDVRQGLRQDFLSKCYLCEGYVGGAFEVEHFRPQAGFPELEHEWTNLFPSHGSCNKRRLKWSQSERHWNPLAAKYAAFPSSGMLDCANGSNVEGRLLQWLVTRTGGVEVFIEAADANDAEAKNTAKELSHIYSAPGSSDSEQLRNAVSAQLNRLQEATISVLVAKDDVTSKAFATAIAELKRLVDRASPFCALMNDALNKMNLPSDIKDRL